MLAYLEGKIKARGSHFVVLGTASGVGYLVYLPPRLIKGDKLSLFVYHYQTEKSDALYGFADFSERELFEQLIKVQGLGPKGAMALLSLYHPKELVQIIEKADLVKIEATPGIGKKIARKILADLTGEIVLDKKEDKVLEDALKSLGFQRQEIQASFNFLTGREKNLQEKITKILKGVGSAQRGEQGSARRVKNGR
jgi:Holliday junction DNA helicase RuvA